MQVKFPRFYRDAAHLLTLACEEDKNIKHILYNDKKYQHCNIKALFAVVSNALKYFDVIETLINESNIFKEHRGLDIWRIRVLVTELVINQKPYETFPNNENYTIQTVIGYDEKFKEILSKLESKKSILDDARCETDVAKVRFIKVNLIKESVNAVVERFSNEGWEQIETAASYEEYCQQLKDLEPHSSVFVQDFHLPEVLVFPPGTELQSHELYSNGSIFFMDKASCLAPLLLSPREDSEVLDMCAAPGLKTIQLASLVPSGKVYAVERDAERFKSLQSMVEQSGADNVITIHRDVTSLDVHQYNRVEYILVDPSCSGSGIRIRQPSSNLKSRLDEKVRLEKLAGFQLTLLRFALTRFPAAKRVVYSTCSLNVEENEEVVEAALNSRYHNFDVVPVQDKLQGWQNFGSSDFSVGHKCFYCRPENDYTNGFFVAVFERKKTLTTILIDSSENDDEMYRNNFKGGKRRIDEKSNIDKIGSNKVSPHKRVKTVCDDQSGKNKENIIVNKDSNSKGEVHKIKLIGRKLSISEKKRSRRKKIKMKKKVFSQSVGNVITKANNHVKNNATDRPVKNKNSHECGDKTVSSSLGKTKERVSKAKLRYKRAKICKLGLVGTKEDITKKNKKDQDHNSLPLNLNKSLEIQLSFHKKKEKRRNKTGEDIIDFNDDETLKIESIKSNKSLQEVTNPNTMKYQTSDVLSETIKGNKNDQTKKKKRKKEHSVEYLNNNISHDFDDGSASVKIDVELTLNERNYVEDMRTHKKKRKEKHSLGNCESNSIEAENDGISVEGTLTVDLRKNSTEETISRSKEEKDFNRTYEVDLGLKTERDDCEDIRTHKKKHKKKQLLGHCENINIEARNYGDHGFESGRMDSEDKITHKKKHKKKGSLGHYENNSIEAANDSTSFEGTLAVDMRKNSTEETVSKIKVEKDFERTYEVDLGFKTESYDGEDIRTHKKKHKKKHSLGHCDYINIEAGNYGDLGFESGRMDSEDKITHKKKHKRKGSLDHYENNSIEAANNGTSFEGTLAVDMRKNSTEETVSKIKVEKDFERTYEVDLGFKTESYDGEDIRTHKKKHKKKHSLGHCDYINIKAGNYGDLGFESIRMGSEDKITHEKKHKKKSTLSHFESHSTEAVNDGNSFEETHIVDLGEKESEKIVSISRKEKSLKKRYKHKHLSDRNENSIT